MLKLPLDIGLVSSKSDKLNKFSKNDKKLRKYTLKINIFIITKKNLLNNGIDFILGIKIIIIAGP